MLVLQGQIKKAINVQIEFVNMSRRHTVILLICLVISSLTLVTVSAQSTEYDIMVDDSIDTPDRTITFDGQSYVVTAVKQADPGDSVSMTVDAPSGNFVEVYVYNADRQIVDSKEIEADKSRPATVSFDLTDYSAGSYAFALSYDGEIKAVHPLIVRAYDVSTTIPSEAAKDEQPTLSTTISQLRPGNKSGVEFVIANDERTRRTDASGSDGNYEATVDLSSFDTGDYTVYATVRGTEQIAGNDSRLGLSQPETLSVTDGSSNTESNNAGSSGGGGSGGGSAGTAETDTATPTSNEQDNITATPSRQETDTQTGTATSTVVPDDNTATQQPTDDQTETTTSTSQPANDADLITPQPTNSATSATTAEDGPGFSWPVAVVALFIAGVTLLAQRQRN